MESFLLVSNTDPRRIVIQPSANSQGKKAAYVLCLEKLAASNEQLSGQGGGRSAPSSLNCTARFQPAAGFNGRQFVPLVSQPIYGCLGLIQVDDGKSAASVVRSSALM